VDGRYRVGVIRKQEVRRQELPERLQPPESWEQENATHSKKVVPEEVGVLLAKDKDGLTGVSREVVAAELVTNSIDSEPEVDRRVVIRERTSESSQG
jgi:hypothetical protein